MNTKLIRNVLNTLFIVLAAVGMYYYAKVSKQTGTYIIIAGMAFKFMDVCMRIMFNNEK
jgi:hypothetical protein